MNWFALFWSAIYGWAGIDLLRTSRSLVVPGLLMLAMSAVLFGATFR